LGKIVEDKKRASPCHKLHKRSLGRVKNIEQEAKKEKRLGHKKQNKSENNDEIR
jgi:hypothetical protein